MKEGHDTQHQHNHEQKKHILKQFFEKILHTHSHSDDEMMSPSETTEEGIKAVKISFAGLMVTALLQVFVVLYTQSIALLADTVHNFSDAFSSIPLWIAFSFSRKSVQKSKYPYGYGKAEDLAGMFIVLLIAASAVLVFVESINRLFNPMSPTNLEILVMAAVIGFLGNEIVARYRINIGRKIKSEALIADGLHSRTDGYVSLSVIIGAIGAYFGFPILDPIVGIAIGILILFILKDATNRIWLRLMDGVDPTILRIIEDETKKVDNVAKVGEARARWVGRSLIAEIEVVVNRDYTVAKAYEIEENIKQSIKNKLPVISEISIIDIPCNHHQKVKNIT